MYTLQIFQNPTNSPLVMPSAQATQERSTPQKVNQSMSTASRDIDTRQVAPPEASPITTIVSKMRGLIRLGITNILVPLVKEIFKRNSQVMIQSQLPPDIANKIKSATTSRPEYMTQAALSAVTQALCDRLETISKNYKLRPGAKELARAILIHVGEKGYV